MQRADLVRSLFRNHYARDDDFRLDLDILWQGHRSAVSRDRLRNKFECEWALNTECDKSGSPCERPYDATGFRPSNDGLQTAASENYFRQSVNHFDSFSRYADTISLGLHPPILCRCDSCRVARERSVVCEGDVHPAKECMCADCKRLRSEGKRLLAYVSDVESLARKWNLHRFPKGRQAIHSWYVDKRGAYPDFDSHAFGSSIVSSSSTNGLDPTILETMPEANMLDWQFIDRRPQMDPWFPEQESKEHYRQRMQERLDAEIERIADAYEGVGFRFKRAKKESERNLEWLYRRLKSKPDPVPVIAGSSGISEKAVYDETGKLARILGITLPQTESTPFT